MAVRRIASSTRAEHMRVGVVVSKFNAEIGERLLQSALKALADSGVAESAISIASVPGALEAPLALQRMAQTGDYDALVALGAVIRGETYHFEIVATESATGLASVQLEFGIPIGNGILTTDTEAQAEARAETKGRDAALAALEMANLLSAIDEE
ncbi:MAG TPA: 6,7-dimethyl-8-ribityllumazine synthase [Casimicrobiaceae bacterium]|jgi:6,7-dimethyl-8-ribityllumazine synthase|nr:6,7-dimethyl-8-ribityllumazine synthase [Casimicrobiaceae bacterium]